MQDSTPLLSDAQNKRHALWNDIKEAFRGTHQNYTHGPVGQAVLLLAIPMILEMIMESVFAVVDIFYVGKLGPIAVATVGFTESILLPIYTLAMGLSIGATATIARRIGEQDRDGAARAAVQSLILGVILSIFLSVVGVIFASTFLHWIGASPEIIDQGSDYARFTLGGNISIMLLFLANAIFRGAGDGAIAMRALWIANTINILLAPILIFGLGPIPGLGVIGAALATTIGRGVGAVYGLTQFLSTRSRVQVEKKHFKVELDIMGKILRLSISATFQVLIETASWAGLTRVLSSFGSQAIAGYTIGLRVILFALFPAFGLSQAAATMVGQALGAKNPERAEKAVWITGLYNFVFLGSISLLFIILGPLLISQFTSDPEVLAFGTNCLRTVAGGFVFFAYGMVFTQAFNGAGDTWTPTLLNFFIFWLGEIPLAYLLAIHLKMGPFGVFLAISVAFSILTVAAAVLFRRGKWKTREV